MREFECEVDLSPARRAKPSPTVVKPQADDSPPVLRTLVLAYQIEQAIVEGRAKSYGDVARQLGLTQPRVTQIVALHRLAPAIQERLLLDRDPRIRGLSEHRLRTILKEPDATRQVERFEELLGAL